MSARWLGGGRIALRHPAQYIVVTFFVTSMLGTALLSLPISTQSSGRAPLTTAMFTAMSATCVTGLSVIDTEGHWSGFGQAVILGLIQVGGLGIMTLSSLLVIVLSRRLGIRQRVVAAAQTGTLRLGDVTSLVKAVVTMTACVELGVAAVLLQRFWIGHDESLGRAAYLAVFHSVSAFNNAGFALFPDNMMRFQDDPILLLALAAAIVIGGLGFPVWHQIASGRRRIRQWDLHAKLTVSTTVVLVVSGWLLFAAFEWTNASTLGPLSTRDSLVNGLFHSVTTRTAGFNSVDAASLNDTSHLLTMILMFIGGGSGSTAGGVKVTTFALLGWVIWAEVRGERDVEVFRRRVPTDVQRQALTVALMAVGGVVVSSMILLALTPHELSDVVFESVSALGTVGLSTGITPLLSTPGQLLVTGLMFIGRVGPPTLFAALVLRARERLYRHPEERIIIG
ncbi:TrkH family potassium uptake protein [Desertimonas flava]|uniref:TrkH family potassium uptake protein n=1 Tax=Desertimonas flava TaxID=2064846 RepID=UPI000E344E1E|nr:potassium transporter TrkG [Desertimonas flava]